jgi:NADPH-dependent curcumin reductase CurA
MHNRRDFIASGSLALAAAALPSRPDAAPRTNRRIVLARRPHGEASLDDFRLEEVPLAALQAGEVLLQTIYLSLDPYMRGRMNEGPSYAPAAEIGQVMVGGTVARVVASSNSAG